MPKIFTVLDKARPAYDVTYKIVMLLCKLLLITDIVIASYAVLGRFCQQLAKKYEFLSFLAAIKDPAWTEEVVLTCMSYMAVLAASLAIRTGAHIRMTALDIYLPKTLIKVLDVVADVAVMVLGLLMVTEGWNYAITLYERGTFYVSLTWLSRFWMYFPVPLAGIAMIVFELEAFYNHIKAFYVKGEGVKS